MRIWRIMVMMMFLGAGAVPAATINLNDGRVVQGDIVKQDNKSIQVNVDGVTMTYYADEIKGVDGKPFMPQAAASAALSVAQPQAVTSAPVAQPEAAANAVSAPTPAPAAATIDPDKKILILKFIDIFGTRKALTNNFNTMLSQIAKNKPDEAEKIRQRVKVDEIIERLLPIYDRNFTSEDLNTFISFYGSTEGQKLIKTIPVLMKESVQESIKYMQEKFPESKQGQP